MLANSSAVAPSRKQIPATSVKIVEEFIHSASSRRVDSEAVVAVARGKIRCMNVRLGIRRRLISGRERRLSRRSMCQSGVV
jgi:hypothetical protein